MKIILDWLIEIRKSQHKSQKECAEATGISQQMFSAIEKEKRNPHPDTAHSIAQALDFAKYGLTWTAFYEKQNTS